MHQAISSLPIEQHINIDGNIFKPYSGTNSVIPYHTTLQGDDKYAESAYASVVAERDADLVKNHPELQDKYQIANNKGYQSSCHTGGLKKLIA